MNKRIPRPAALASTCLVFGSLLAVLITPYRELLNADLILPVNLLIDLRSGVDISTWNWSPNNFYFPEIIYYLGVGSLFQAASPLFIHMLYPIFSGTLFGTAYYYLHTRVLSSREEGVWVKNLLPVFPLGIAILSYLTKNDIIQVIVLPETHSGAYLACLASAILASLDITSKPGARRVAYPVFLVIICFIAALSDYFFILWFTIPFLAALAHFHLARKEVYAHIQYLRSTSIIVLFSSLAGYILHKGTNSTKADTQISLERMLTSFHTLSDVLAHHRYIAVYSLTSLLVSTILFFAVLKPSPIGVSRTSKISVRTTLFWMWNFYSIFTTLLLIIAHGMPIDYGSTRYFQPFFFSPVLAGMWGSINLAIHFYSYGRFRIWRKSIFAGLYVGALLLALAALPGYFSAYTRDQGYKLTQCLKSAGVEVWYSEYWNSKPVHAFSNGSIIPRQITNDGLPYRWNNNDSWYSQEPSVSGSKTAIMLDTDFSKRISTSTPTIRCGNKEFKMISQDTLPQ